MAYSVTLYVTEETGLVYGFILYEPANAPINPDYNWLQLSPPDEAEKMGQWWADRGIGPFDIDLIDVEIPDDVAMEAKMRWNDPDHCFDLDDV